MTNDLIFGHIGFSDKPRLIGTRIQQKYVESF